MKKKGLATILVFCLLLSSCAYYNTFYNAKTAYSSAMKAKLASSNQKAPADLLDKTIKKCGKLIKYYPKSKWVDDAIVLMGKAYFENGEYDKAIRKFQELTIYYPESPLVLEAIYLTGVTHHMKEDYNFAIASFDHVIGFIDNEFADDAAHGALKSYTAKSDSSNLLQLGKKFLQSFPKSPFLPQVLLLMADTYIENGNYSEAIAILKRARDRARKREDKNDVEEKYAVTMIRMGNIEEGLSILKKLSKRTSLPERTAKLVFEITDAYIDDGNIKKALSELDDLVSLYSTGPFVAEAFYRKGLIYENELNDIESAVTAYENTLKLNPTQDIRTQTTRRNTVCKEIRTYREKIANPDSTTGVDKMHFLLAETFLFGKHFIDSALTQYQNVLDSFPESPLAPKAAIAIGWLYEKEKNDTVKALIVYELVIKKFPDTEYSEEASTAINKLRVEANSSDKFNEKNK